MPVWFVEVAQGWWRLYALHTVESSVFLLLVWLIDRLVALHSRMRYSLWLLALIKFFIPPVMQWPLPEESATGVAGLANRAILVPTVSVSAISRAAEGFLPVAEILFGLWSLSVVVLALLVGYQSRRLALRLRQARRVAPEHLIRYSVLRHVPSLPVYVCDDLTSPLLTGLVRPRLYLPTSCLHWKPHQLDAILAHEVSHYRHRDLMWLALQHLALILFALNPLVWLLHVRLQQIREQRCDAQAVALSGITPAEYARLLLAFLEQRASLRPRPLLGQYFAETADSLKQRFAHLLDQAGAHWPRLRLHHRLSFAAMTLLLLAFSWQWDGSLGNLVESPAGNESQPAAPPPAPDQQAVFVAYDKPPMPVGGFEAIQSALKLPEGDERWPQHFESKIIINLFVAETGEVRATRILKSSGYEALDNAAAVAAASVRWQPATQNGRPVGVWVGIPVIIRYR